MTPEQVDLVRAGMAQLSPHSDELAGAFYRRLFAARPDLRTMFPADLSAQRLKFAAELEAIVLAIPDFGSFVRRVRDLGARHREYGVAAAHYAVVREALLGALGERLGDAWTDDMEASWRQAYDLVSETMMLGASGAEPTARV